MSLTIKTKPLFQWKLQIILYLRIKMLNEGIKVMKIVFLENKLCFMITINTALASYGMSGIVFHGPLLETHSGFKITKILERNKNNSEGKHPGSELVRDYDSILQDKNIELIVVNTPDYLHYEMSMQALEAGKHIVVEKPFTLKSEEANKIIELGKKKGLMVSVFHNRRWDGDSLTVRKIIKEGELGRLVSYESHFDRFRNFIQTSWKEDNSLGAGTLYNLGSHMIDEALNIFGMPKFLFADVRGMRTNSKVDDSFDIILHYPKVKCLVRGSYLVKEQGPRYILHGTEGSFLKPGLDPQEAMLKEGKAPNMKNWGEDDPTFYGTLNTGIGGEEVRKLVPTTPGNYLAYYDNIYAHIRNNDPLAVKPEEARDVIRIIEAAYESAEKEMVIKL
jgi:scyllo-inositol 2-dehydrogenase (NADP+)